MVRLNKTINVNGISEVGEEGRSAQVAYMNATIGTDGNFNISRTIQDREAFELHKKDVLMDFAAFDEYIYSIVSDNQELGGINQKDGDADAESTQ